MEKVKTILVTGGAGFIGSSFVRHIFKKCRDHRMIVIETPSY